jgi:hypothetical protein
VLWCTSNPQSCEQTGRVSQIAAETKLDEDKHHPKVKAKII